MLLAMCAVVAVFCESALCFNIHSDHCHAKGCTAASAMHLVSSYRRLLQTGKTHTLLLLQQANGVLMPLRGGAQEEGVRCRLKKGGEIFEVLCHAAKVELFREGAAQMEDVLITHKVRLVL
jgi:hypothetical protein